ncbi:MAG TPA: ABC transporter substrate-binding protein [Candidatus Saccharimonadales bacterium]|nr:ABC transporter substrate-binding protein [Candidatus Saccharimonadales bacterium]
MRVFPKLHVQPRILRRFRRSQRQVGDFGVQTGEHIEQHLVRRFNSLMGVRRFIAGWFGLVILLIGTLVAQNLALSGYYQTVRPVPGGIYNEGVLGRFTNANPLYATSDADTTVSRLVFSGLLANGEHGRLVGDLASGYEVSDHGARYTVHLRPDLKWQDGHPLTSRDVLFTYRAIQNPDAQSPLMNSWRGVTLSAPDDHTVIFQLPGTLASFPYNLTTGIVPEHLLSKVAPADMRSADFNTVHPVGAGPFAWQAVRVSDGNDPDNISAQIALTPYAGYHAGEPRLQKFVVHVFASKPQLIEAFESNQLTGAEGLDKFPSQLKGEKEAIVHSLPVRAANMVFFKVSEGVLADKPVRQALVRATDINEIVKRLGYTTRQVREPLLVGQLAYDPSLTQLPFDVKAAKKLLDKNGWRVGKDGVRIKDKQRLEFSLSAANNSENRMVVWQLQRQWRELGVRVDIRLQNGNDFRNTLANHDYEAVLDGIAIGPDPDVFVYWDSSQADIRSSNRLNLSEYKNKTADTALESGRTRLDPALRVIKYKPFLKAWREDAPALGLYQPRLLYLTNGSVAGLSDGAINVPADRFANVHNWEIRRAKITD